MSRKTEVSSIMVRLTTEVEGVIFSTSWWGPNDNLRFAIAVSSSNSLETPEGLLKKEEVAKKRFTKKIESFMKLFE